MVVAPNIIRTIKTSKGDATYSTYDLLDEIKSRPSIWQVGGVVDRTEYHNSWRSISEILISQFCDLDEEEQNEITQTLRKLYGKLKKDLTLFLNYKKNGDKRYRIFNYGYKMAYVLQDRGMKLEDVFSQEEINEMKLFEKRFKQCYGTKNAKEFNMEDEYDHSNIKENIENEEPEICYNNYDITPEEGNIIPEKNYNLNRNYERQTRKPKDADQAFFDSLKPWLRKMNGEQKLDFKIKFLQTLKKYQN